MRTFVPDRTCWSLLLTALVIRLRYKPTYDKIRVLIINKDVRKLLARKNGNENPIWSWMTLIQDDVIVTISNAPGMFFKATPVGCYQAKGQLKISMKLINTQLYL